MFKDECLIVGYSKDNSNSSLCVSRRSGYTIEVINMFKDKEADELFEKLTEGSCNEDN